MKTQRCLWILSICYLIVTATFAAPNELPKFKTDSRILKTLAIVETPEIIIRLEQKQVGRINLQLANLKALTTEIKLLDLEGKLWFSKTIRKANGYAEEYDVRSLPVGTYFISIQNTESNYQQLFQRKGEALVVFQGNEKNTRKELVQLVNQVPSKTRPNLGKVRVLALGRQKVKIEVNALSSINSRIELKSLGGTKIIAIEAPEKEQYTKVFNLEGLTPGDYYFIIESDATKVIQFLSFSKRHGIQMNTQQQLID